MGETFAFKKHQKVYLFFKRGLDIVGSFLGIVLLGLLMLFLALITKCMSKGPALYKQKRIGKKEKLFTMLKFRSMRANVPPIPPSELSDDEQLAMTTKWGHFMRRTSLDELPQLFNVFAGHMSFIGPRPQQEKENEPKCYAARKSTNPNAFEVRPGMCSLAIIKMHRSHSPVEKANYDSEYVRKLSFKLDTYVFFCALGIFFGFRPKDKGNKVIDGSIGVFLKEDGSLGKIKTVDEYLSGHICDKLGYPSSIGDKDYLDAIDHWVFEENYSRIHNLYSVFTGASLGGTGAISIAFNTFLEAGKTVLLPNIMWGNYMLLAEKAGLRHEKYDLFDEKEEFNFASLKEHIHSSLEKDGRTLAVINDPCQNPTGYCLSEEEYDELFAVLNREGEKGELVVLFDIAYFSYYSVPGSKCKLIDKLAESKTSFFPLIAFSCSKVFALYGMRMGALLALTSSEEEQVEVSSAYAAQARGTYSCPVGASGHALSLALDDSLSKEKILKEIAFNKEEMRQRGEILLKELDKERINHYPYRSGFFLTIKVSKDANEIYEKLKKKHIYVVPLSEHELRIALSGLSKDECLTLVGELKATL